MGPCLSERLATVREDYSQDGDVWNYIIHDISRSKATIVGVRCRIVRNWKISPLACE